ncbi:MAG: hypothetical protein ACRDKL_09115 [Solirubrobacteraceae bacterium]
MPETCIWCAAAVTLDSGFRAHRTADGRCASFCRLEHVVPWVLRGARWVPGGCIEPAPAERPGACAHCGCRLGDDLVLLVHHRGVDRIGDGFCTLEHLRAWANAGGRWGRR